jgi:lysozyme
MIREIPSPASSFIQKGEGLRLTAYLDSVGVWTIGWGHTGPEVVKGLTITRAKAVEYLKADMAIAVKRLEKVLKRDTILALSDNQYSALISFVFNLGADPSWNFWKVVNAQKWEAVPPYMMRFVYGRVNGKMQIIKGLQHRRAAEGALWNECSVAACIAIIKASPDKAPPSSETREMETPPAPAPVKPLLESKSFVTSVVSAGTVAATTFVGVAPDVATSLQETATKLDPIADNVEFVNTIRNVMLTIVALITISVPIFLWIKNRNARLS